MICPLFIFIQTPKILRRKMSRRCRAWRSISRAWQYCKPARVKCACGGDPPAAFRVVSYFEPDMEEIVSRFQKAHLVEQVDFVNAFSAFQMMSAAAASYHWYGLVLNDLGICAIEVAAPGDIENILNPLPQSYWPTSRKSHRNMSGRFLLT